LKAIRWPSQGENAVRWYVSVAPEGVVDEDRHVVRDGHSGREDVLVAVVAVLVLVVQNNLSHGAAWFPSLPQPCGRARFGALGQIRA